MDEKLKNTLDFRVANSLLAASLGQIPNNAITLIFTYTISFPLWEPWDANLSMQKQGQSTAKLLSSATQISKKVLNNASMKHILISSQK